MSAKNGKGGSTFSSGANGGGWSGARERPLPPVPSSKSPPDSPPPDSPKSPIIRASLRTALEAPELLGGAIPGDTWLAWRALLLAIMGEPLKEDELELYRRFTAR